MIPAFQNTLVQLETALKRIVQKDYIKKSVYLEGATIGQHTRHILELVICLCNGYADGQVNYDHRKRDLQIENEIGVAIETLQNVLHTINKANKQMEVLTFLSDAEIKITTSYERELLYNMEHCIHHLALIKVALLEFELPVEKNFGVAPSTIKYREQCAP